jgi:hypothetical protein
MKEPKPECKNIQVKKIKKNFITLQKNIYYIENILLLFYEVLLFIKFWSYKIALTILKND